MTDKLNNSKNLVQQSSRPLEKALYAFIYFLSASVLLLVLYFIVYILSKGLPHISWSFFDYST